jgi:WD40 repeat protein
MSHSGKVHNLLLTELHDVLNLNKFKFNHLYNLPHSLSHTPTNSYQSLSFSLVRQPHHFFLHKEGITAVAHFNSIPNHNQNDFSTYFRRAQICSADLGSNVKHVDVEKGQVIAQIMCNGAVCDLCCAQDGRLFVGVMGSPMAVWDLREKSPTVVSKAKVVEDEMIKGIVCVGRKIVFPGSDESVSVYDSLTGRVEVLYAHDYLVNSLITVGHNIIVSGSYDKMVKIWDLSRDKMLKEIKTNGNVTSLIQIEQA